MKSAAIIVCFHVVNEKNVLFSIKLKRLKGIAVNNDDIYLMLLRI